MSRNVTSFTHRHDREQYRLIGKAGLGNVNDGRSNVR